MAGALSVTRARFARLPLAFCTCGGAVLFASLPSPCRRLAFGGKKSGPSPPLDPHGVQGATVRTSPLHKSQGRWTHSAAGTWTRHGACIAATMFPSQCAASLVDAGLL